jgi:two-component system NtrC family sensor kinase
MLQPGYHEPHAEVCIPGNGGTMGGRPGLAALSAVTVTRIQDRHRAEAFARLFEAVHEGVFIGALVVDPAGGPDLTVAVNPYLKEMLGHGPQVPDKDVLPFANERFVDSTARQSFLGRLVKDGSVTDHLLRLRRQDGGFLWVEVTAQAAPVQAGAVRIEALVRDVSERRRIDDQSRDLYQQLLQAEKMAALGQTISGVAHELNNPLATILSWAERLAEKTEDAGSKRALDVILAESERAARIVRNLLTFARKRQSTRSLIDLSEVVRETLALRAYEHRVSNIQVAMDLTPDMPSVFADGHQIRQVLLNLVINAEQAMLSFRGRGTLSVHTRYDVPRASAVLEVSDDGPGISADIRGKVFDPFFTTKDPGEGTGLGLTVAYAIIEEHGGRIRVTSPPTGGACFTVELPVSSVEATQLAVSASPHAGRTTPRASVLLVEDERALAAVVVEALRDAGLDVDHAGDGEDALIRVHQCHYDVVVCDLKMPRLDGMALYRAIAAAKPELARRVIFVTGDVAGPEAERFLEDSGCRWFAKPFRLGDLVRSVREALA